MTAMNGQTPAFGWYGKSPATGDFISRRLSRPMIDALDRWFQSGLTALRERAPERWENVYAKAPVWNGLLPGGIVAAQPCLASIAPSSDRVGRRFPFCVVAEVPARSNGWMRALGRRGVDLSRVVEQSLRAPLPGDELDKRLHDVAAHTFAGDDAGAGDDIGSVLEDLAIESVDLATVPLDAQSAFPWPDLAQRFDPGGTASYWWTAGKGGAGFVHRGALDADLFVTLFGGACLPT
jgi:type VI secretion system protein ImpM